MVTILDFIGDISLNDEYKRKKFPCNPFSGVADTLRKADFVVGNLESIAEGKDGVNILKKPRLSTTTNTLDYLNGITLNLVSLAHNHVYDNLGSGLETTTKWLSSKGIDSIGASLSKETIYKSKVVQIQGKKFCFLNYVTLDTHPSLPDNVDVYLNVYDKDLILSHIRECKKDSDFVALLFHWGGGYENGVFPESYQIKDAHAFIDAGADLIVGHHPHVLQPYERYKGKYVFYSLGNFCFADVECEERDLWVTSNNCKSIILQVSISENLDYTIKPVFIKRNSQLEVVLSKHIDFMFKFRLFVFQAIKNKSFISYIYMPKYKLWDSRFSIYFSKGHPFNEKMGRLFSGLVRKIDRMKRRMLL